MRRAPSKHIHMASTDERGATMAAELLYSDAKWLLKLCNRIELAASKNFPHDQFRIRMTTTEVKRSERIAKSLRWLIQHVDIGKMAGKHIDIDTERVPRGNPNPKPETIGK